jgi:aminoglycoside phosphotransferase (APT) family kinase protein
LIESRLGLFAADQQVVTHGDASFANVLWDGERAALVDFESCGLAPLDRELDLLLRFLGAPAEFSPESGARQQAPIFSPVLPWLRDAYPEMFSHPDLLARLEVYDALWELVQLLNYPADNPRRTADRLDRILAGDARWKAPVAGLL